MTALPLHIQHPYTDHDDKYSESSPLQEETSLSPTSQVPARYSLSISRFFSLDNLKRLIVALIPSFITTSSATTPSKSGIPTLDGLRGLACLFVFNEHFVVSYQSRETQTWIMRVPPIRLLWYGKASVFLFFVISGYVLSYKPLKLMRSKNFPEFQTVISSSFFRRGMRLYLPCLIISFIACIATYMGICDRSAKVFNTYKEFLFLKKGPPPRMNFVDQLNGYLTNVDFIFSATIPFDKDTRVRNYFTYDDHQWTIPKEFRSSMAVFAVLTATSRMTSKLRMATVAALFVYAVYSARIYTSLFFAGMFMAEFDLIRQDYCSCTKKSLPGFSNDKPRGRMYAIMHLPDTIYNVMWISLFVLGVWMISSPQEGQQIPNYLPHQLRRWGMTDATNIDNSLLLVGSILTVWSVAVCPTTGHIFNSPIVTYLGKISYALYLMHGILIKSLGITILPWTLRMATWTPNEVAMDSTWWQGVSVPQTVGAWLLGWIIVGPICFWLSDLFWRFVDIPCVSFARMVETWATKGANAENFATQFNTLPSDHRAFAHRSRAASVGADGHACVEGHLNALDPKRKNG